MGLFLFLFATAIFYEPHHTLYYREQRSEWMRTFKLLKWVLMRRRISSGVACLEIICDRNVVPINLIGHVNNEPLACVERNGPAASKRMDAMLLDASGTVAAHSSWFALLDVGIHHFWLVSRGQRALLHNSHVGTRKTNEPSQGQDFFCNLLKQFYDVASTTTWRHDRSSWLEQIWNCYLGFEV